MFCYFSSFISISCCDFQAGNENSISAWDVTFYWIGRAGYGSHSTPNDLLISKKQQTEPLTPRESCLPCWLQTSRGANGADGLNVGFTVTTATCQRAAVAPAGRCLSAVQCGERWTRPPSSRAGRWTGREVNEKTCQSCTASLSCHNNCKCFYHHVSVFLWITTHFHTSTTEKVDWWWFLKCSLWPLDRRQAYRTFRFR